LVATVAVRSTAAPWRSLAVERRDIVARRPKHDPSDDPDDV
jgi:hypothetical protein